MAIAKSGNVYLALSVRNVGAGIGVLHGWYVWPDQQTGRQDHRPPEDFRVTTRDLLIRKLKPKPKWKFW